MHVSREGERERVSEGGSGRSRRDADSKIRNPIILRPLPTTTKVAFELKRLHPQVVSFMGDRFRRHLRIHVSPPYGT